MENSQDMDMVVVVAVMAAAMGTMNNHKWSKLSKFQVNLRFFLKQPIKMIRSFIDAICNVSVYAHEISSLIWDSHCSTLSKNWAQLMFEITAKRNNWRNDILKEPFVK